MLFLLVVLEDPTYFNTTFPPSALLPTANQSPMHPPPPITRQPALVSSLVPPPVSLISLQEEPPSSLQEEPPSSNDPMTETSPKALKLLGLEQQTAETPKTKMVQLQLLSSPVYTRGLIRKDVWRKRYFTLSNPRQPGDNDYGSNDSQVDSPHLTAKQIAGVLNYYRLEEEDHDSRYQDQDFSNGGGTPQRGTSQQGKKKPKSKDKDVRQIHILWARPWDVSKDRKPPTFNSLVEREEEVERKHQKQMDGSQHSRNSSPSRSPSRSCVGAVGAGASPVPDLSPLSKLRSTFKGDLNTLSQPFVFYGSTPDGYSRVYHCAVIVDPLVLGLRFGSNKGSPTLSPAPASSSPTVPFHGKYKSA